MREPDPMHVIVEVLAETVVSLELRERLEAAGVSRDEVKPRPRRRRRTA